MFEKEKAVLVALEFNRSTIPLQEALSELAKLTHTAGAQVITAITQKRDKPDSKYFIGSGKLEELFNLVKSTQATVVIFNHDLHASQERNLMEYLGVKVIDRTRLILDIFALHAHSREGILQVELAQNQFALTRLVGHGILMSRLGGGIGTRGPGETKLEVDRRRINRRISILKNEINNLQKQRRIRREKRKSVALPLITLVGYTNAGKSTILNLLTKSSVDAQDKLFATLDPTTRRLYLSNQSHALLTDTVGFIRFLPHQLIDAFHATLEEVIDADLLIHVVDISNVYFEDQISAVYRVLEELNAISKPIITIFNKIDLNVKKTIIKRAIKKYKPAVAISALEKKDAAENLLKTIQKQLQLPANR